MPYQFFILINMSYLTYKLALFIWIILKILCDIQNQDRHIS